MKGIKVIVKASTSLTDFGLKYVLLLYLSFRKLYLKNEYNLPKCQSVDFLNCSSETGLWEKYSFIYLSGQFKEELTSSLDFNSLFVASIIGCSVIP